MIARYNNISLALGVPGLVLQVVGAIMKPEENPTASAIGFLGTVLLIAGLAMYAKAKGRSPAWGLFGLLSLIGLLILALLKDHTENPRREYETPPPSANRPPPLPPR